MKKSGHGGESSTDVQAGMKLEVSPCRVPGSKGRPWSHRAANFSDKCASHFPISRNNPIKCLVNILYNHPLIVFYSLIKYFTNFSMVEVLKIAQAFLFPKII